METHFGFEEMYCCFPRTRSINRYFQDVHPSWARRTDFFFVAWALFVSDAGSRRTTEGPAAAHRFLCLRSGGGVIKITLARVCPTLRVRARSELARPPRPTRVRVVFEIVAAATFDCSASKSSRRKTSGRAWLGGLFAFLFFFIFLVNFHHLGTRRPDPFP